MEARLEVRRMSNRREVVKKSSIKAVQSKMSKCTSVENRVHVLTHKNGWAIKREGASKASKVFHTKEAAVNNAVRLKSARNVIVHKKNGAIASWKKAEKSRK